MKAGYLALGVFLVLLLLPFTELGTEQCSEPYTVTLFRAFNVSVAILGIWLMGVFWGERYSDK